MLNWTPGSGRKNFREARFHTVKIDLYNCPASKVFKTWYCRRVLMDKRFILCKILET